MVKLRKGVSKMGPNSVEGSLFRPHVEELHQPWAERNQDWGRRTEDKTQAAGQESRSSFPNPSGLRSREEE